MTRKMIALVGEQPIPNLLPINYENPETVLLVYTSRTESTSRRLQRVIEEKTAVHFCHVENPYDISEIYYKLAGKIDKLGWEPAGIVFNLTSGTKTMALAAYQLAAERNQEFLYLESEQGRSRLRQYGFEARVARLKQDTIIPGVITIEDYLGSHLEAYQYCDFHDPFERVVYDILEGNVDEIAAAVQDPTGTLDLDLVVRVENQVGIIEVKTGRKGRRKEGIDQLNTAGGRAFLGIYTKKFLVVDSSWNRLTNLSELARARNITVIQLPSYGQTQQVSDEDRQHLIQIIKTTLGGS